MYWALACIWLLHPGVKIPHIKGEAYYGNSTYEPLYHDYLPIEFAVNGELKFKYSEIRIGIGVPASNFKLSVTQFEIDAGNLSEYEILCRSCPTRQQHRRFYRSTIVLILLYYRYCKLLSDSSQCNLYIHYGYYIFENKRSSCSVYIDS